MSLSRFYRDYLLQHQSVGNRRLHFVGTTGMIVVVFAVVATMDPRYLLLLPVVGYGFAWIGHYFIEKNKPATFRHPVKSFLCDLLMYRDIILGRVSLTKTSPVDQPMNHQDKEPVQ